MKFENVIICNDVRVERSGKHILIGVFLENMLFGKFPGDVIVTLWTQFFYERNGNIPIEFRVLFGNEAIVTGQGTLQVEDHTKLITTYLPRIRLSIEKSGMLTFQIREAGKRWTTLKKMPVGLRDTAASSD